MLLLTFFVIHHFTPSSCDIRHACYTPYAEKDCKIKKTLYNKTATEKVISFISSMNFLENEVLID